MARRLFALFAIAVLFSACALTDPALDRAGVVRFVDVEGGCWVIEEGNQRLEPINLEAAYRVDGLDVRFQADERPDLASICMVGQLVELTGIAAEN